MNKKEISVGINVTARLEQAEAGLRSLQNQIGKLSIPNSVRNEFLDLFSSMEKEFDKIAQKTADGKLKLIDSSAAEKSIDKIDALYSTIIHKFESRGIASAGLKKDQQAISAINVAIKGYAAATKEITAEENKLNASIEKQERAKEELLERQKKQTVATHAEIEAQKMKTKSLDEELKKKKDILAATEKELKRKIEESGGKYTEKQLTEKTPQKGPSIKKTDAYRAWKAAMDDVNVTSKGLEQAKLDLGNMATLEEQARAIEAVNEKIAEAKKRVQDFLNTTKPGKEQTAFTEIKKQLEEMEGIDWSSLGINLKEIKNIDQLKLALEKAGEAAMENSTIFSQQMLESLRAVGVTANGVGEDIRGATTALRDINAEAQRTEAFQNRIKSFLGLSGAAQVLRRALRDAMSTIKELDATMTEMAVVTDLTVGDYWDQLPEYSKQASELGVSINSAYEAATLYYQQGLKGNEVTKISAQTLKMARIAGLSAADATDKMTAALRGFNMELNEASAQKVADVYSQLAAITAADVNEISSAMSKTASIAHSAGMEFETTAAFLAQIVETTRESAETAGTALKTVIARFQELKKDPSEIGEVDGEIVDANKIETALRSVGVALRDSSGQFRELDDVFMELSQKWNTLDTNTQRYIATIAAGSRQQSRFIAMMSDYARTQELVTAANNSAGASQEQFGKTLESLDSKITKLKNAWHEFTMGILNSDLVKLGVDILTKFLEALNKATSAFKGLGGSITKIASVITIFKIGSKIFDKFKQPISDLFNWVSDESGTVGYRAGKNYAQRFKQGLSEEFTPEMAGAEKSKAPEENKEVEDAEKTKQSKLRSFSGIGAIQAGQKQNKAAREQVYNQIIEEKREKLVQEKKHQRDVRYSKAVERFDKIEHANYENLEEHLSAQKELKEAQEEYNKEIVVTNEELKLTKEEQKKVTKAGAEGWDTIGQGLKQMGSAAVGAGVSISMLGGLLSSLGLEEVGQGFAQVGSFITLVGTAMTAVGPIVSGLVKKLVAGGVSVQAAWWWVTLIAAAVMALIAGIVYAAKEIKKNSPEGKLEAARDAAKSAAEAADEAASSYDNLVSSLDSLGDKYENLEKITKGTKEWNQAIQDINNSVLELITSYPELASLVRYVGGVFTLNTESTEVQGVINDALGKKIETQNWATMTKVAVTQAQAKVDYKNMSTSAKNALSLGRDGEDFVNLLSQIGEAGKEVLAYTKTIEAAEAQQNAAYAGIASSAQLLADTFAMTAEEITQSSFAVDEEISKKFYDQKMAQLDGVDFTAKDKNISDENKNLLNNAIKEAYGPDAKIEQGKVKYNKNGEDAEVTLTNESIKALIATQYATDQSANAISYYDEAIDKIGGTLGKTTIGNIYSAKEGGALTRGDIEKINSFLGDGFAEQWVNKTDAEKKNYADNLDLLPKEVRDLWNSLSSEEQSVYGNDVTKLVDDLAEGAYFAEQSFKEAGKAAQSFMNADMAKMFQEKLEKAIDPSAIQEATQSLFDNKIGKDGRVESISEEERQHIQNRINMADWTSQESLLALQIALENQFGYTRKQAEQYIEILGKQSRATSDLNKSTDAFGKFFQATQRVESALEKLTDLQWKYTKALRKNANALELGDLQKQQKQTIKDRFEGAREAYSEAQLAQGREYAKGVSLIEGIDLTREVAWNEETQSYDYSKLNKIINGIEDEDDKKLALDWKNSLEEARKTTIEQNKILKDSYDQLEEIEEAEREGYENLWEQIGETLTAQMEEQIQTEQKLLEATKEANSNIISKLQEQINDTRQARENKKAEEEIGDLYSRLSYLGLDTSGANSLEMLELQKQIDEAEEGYQDSLVDQAIQSLQDSNDKAYEQRERQITLAEQQLEIYRNSAAHQANIQQEMDEYLSEYEQYEKNYQAWQLKSLGRADFEKIYGELTTQEHNDLVQLGQTITEEPTFKPEDTTLGQLMVQNGVLLGMSELQKESYWKQLATNTANAAGYTEQTSSNTSTRNLANQLEAIEKNTAQQYTKIGLEVAGERDKEFFDATGFDIGGSTKTDAGGASWVNDDGTVRPEAQNYIDTTLAATTEANAVSLQNSDSAGTNLYDTWKDYAGGNADTFLSKEAFYEKINKGETVQVGSKNFTRENLTNALASGSTEYSYGDYVTSYTTTYTDSLTKTKNRKDIETEASDWIKTAQKTAYFHGMQTVLDPDTSVGEEYYEMETRYMANDGDAEDLKALVSGQINSGVVEGTEIYPHGNGGLLTDFYKINIPQIPGAKNQGEYGENEGKWVSDSSQYEQFDIYYQPERLRHLYQNDITAMVDGTLYAWRNFSGWGNHKEDSWGRIDASDSGGGVSTRRYLAALRAYKTGGLVDFTGPAWLDGTKSKPEIVLNQRDSANFIVLRDILGEVLQGASTINNSNSQQKGGDNHFDIDINVEKIDSDYDVEQIANKIRSMIYEDAAYRNVQSIGFMR